MEAAGILSDQKNTLDTSSDHVVPEEHPVEKGHQTRYERRVSVDRTTLEDVITSMSYMTGDAMTALVTPEGSNGCSKTVNRLKCMPEDFKIEEIGEKLGSV